MKRKASGVITIYLSMTLLILMSFCFTLLESARCDGIKLRALLAANAAVESAFAQYDKELFDNYGLLFFASRNSDAIELVDEAKKYAEKNSKGDWLSFRTNGVVATNFASATDQNGNVFIKSVSNYMKKSGLAQMAIEKSKECFDDKNNLEDLSTNGEFSFEKLQDRIDEVENEAANEADKKADKQPEEIAQETLNYENNPDDEKLKDEYDDLINEFSNWKNKAILSLVCDDASEISDEPFNESNFPSQLSNETKSRSDGKIEVSNTDKILFKEYIIATLSSYIHKKSNGLNLEYVICGKTSDLANLSSIVKMLIAIRLGFNYIDTRTDAKKVSSALAIATAVIGWLGIPSLISAIQEIVLIIWALKDSILDVKLLLKNKEVTTSKSINLKLSYEGYLRALLYTKDSGKSSYRTMDMIQKKVCLKEPPFLFKNCIYGAKIQLNATDDALFPCLPGLIDYNFFVSSQYAYGPIVF